MAVAVVSVALATFRDLLLEEGRFLVGVGDEVRALQTQLREIKCLWEDADRRQHESKSVSNWISEIRDLAYRAEDAIASYAVRISSEARGRGLKQLLRQFFHALNCYPLHRLGHEISDIKSKLARVTTNMKDYGIGRIIDGAESSNQNWTRKTFPNFEIGDCFVGKEVELKHVASLVGDDNQHRVVSIWGMGGIGKTTIAKKVYQQMIQTKNFDCFAWVCITQQCQIRSVLEVVLKQLISEKGDGISSLSEEQLIEQLCEIQRAKRCLIVLDDLWETAHWDGFKHAFLVQDLKSKILVTTRKQNVAEIGFSLQLGLLKMDEALELLKKKSFPHANIPADFAFQEKFHEIGKEMVQKCGYMPLAVSLLGGVLSKKNSIKEWELVNANISESIYRGEGQGRKENQIEQVLHLSYEDLPYYLKPCFLYLAKLREDETINHVQDIYGMWIAQGMISYENIRGKDETLREIAELYLSELVSRCIIEVEVYVEDVPTIKYRTCKLHDVVRELCVSMGKKEDFGVQILQYRSGNFSALLHEALSCIKTRHLVIHFQREFQQDHDELSIACEEDASKHLRSLEIQSDIKGKTIECVVDFQKFKMLRSLVFVRFKFSGRKLPRGITNLIHLKYLRLEECELDKLPSSMSSLAYLDTLDLSKSWNVRVPNVLKKMFRLKHLYLPYYNRETIGNYQLRLDVGDELETLFGFDSSVHELVSITGMKNLRCFRALIRDTESLSTIINAIATEWTKLLFCAVHIDCQLTSEEGVRKLKQVFTCPNLYSLGIYVQLGKQLADCISDINTSKLVGLLLFGCEIEDDPMVILGNLSFLKYFYFYSRSFVGEKMTCPAFSFPRLKKLILKDLPNLREWRVEQGAMPLLFEIEMDNCSHLEKVPDGLSSITTLQKLTISQMPEMGKRVSASGEDFHKVCHIPSIFIN